MARGLSISVAIDTRSGFRIAVARCRAARDELRRLCRFDGRLQVASGSRFGMPAIVFRVV